MALRAFAAPRWPRLVASSAPWPIQESDAAEDSISGSLEPERPHNKSRPHTAEDSVIECNPSCPWRVASGPSSCCVRAKTWNLLCVYSALRNLRTQHHSSSQGPRRQLPSLGSSSR